MKLNNKTKSIFIILALIALIVGYMTYQRMNSEKVEDNTVKGESEQIQTAKTDWDAYKEGNKSFASDEEKQEFLFETFRLLAHDDLITAINEIENAGEFEDMLVAAEGVSDDQESIDTLSYSKIDKLSHDGSLNPLSLSIFWAVIGGVEQDGLFDQISDKELVFMIDMIYMTNLIQADAGVLTSSSVMKKFYSKYRNRTGILTSITDSVISMSDENKVYEDLYARVNVNFLIEVEESGDYDLQEEIDQLKLQYSQLAS